MTHSQDAYPADGAGGSQVSNPPAQEAARILCDTRTLTSDILESAGAIWKLAEPGRQLDANVIHLPPGEGVDTHAEPDLDVLLLVLAGDGTLDAAGRTRHVADGALAWLPRGSSRSLTAGNNGMSYLTVHRRRPGMQIRRVRAGETDQLLACP